MASIVLAVDVVEFSNISAATVRLGKAYNLPADGLIESKGRDLIIYGNGNLELGAFSMIDFS
jgi:hypothetical protein